MRKMKSRMWRQGVWAITVLFVGQSLWLPAGVSAQTVSTTVAKTSAAVASVPVVPCILRGVALDPQNPLRFDFIVDTGDDHLQGEALRRESLKLARYFLTALTVPKDQLWVNLSPEEKDRIIPSALSVTEMGRDMLSQDYELKQKTASLTHPDQDLGKLFWSKVYRRAQEVFGTTKVPVNTLNRVWIVPDRAVVYENSRGAYVGERHLKVMLEADYLQKQHPGAAASKEKEDVSADIVREVLLPEIEREVNEGAAFASLRQIYNSMILAAWYKQRLKDSLLGQVYADRNKVAGVDLAEKDAKEKVYAQYMEAFEKGVYNLIREDLDPATQRPIPRKYFSGGLAAPEVEIRQGPEQAAVPAEGKGTNLMQMTMDLAEVTTVPAAADAIVADVAFEDPQPIKTPFEAGLRNNIGTFMPFQQIRSEQDWGSGDFGSMMTGVDVHAAVGHSIIQSLPLTKSAADDSPYSVGSSLMLDEVYMSPALAQKKFNSPAGQKFMTDHQEEIRALNQSDEVNFAAERALKRNYLKAVWQDVKTQQTAAVRAFLKSMDFKDYGSLEDHILYDLLKTQYMADEAAAGVHWTRSRKWDWRLWDAEVRDRQPEALARLKRQYRAQIDFEAFVQFVEYGQFKELQDYGRSKGVGLMVDIPYAFDGADIWLNPRVFGLKKENGYRAMTKQGVPPEQAYPGGQYWQFFPYDWAYEGTIPFLMRRYQLTQDVTDLQRLDHVLGFYRQFRFIEDVAGRLTLENLGLYEKIAAIQQKAVQAGTPGARQQAVDQVRDLIIKKFLALRQSLPEEMKDTIPENALALLMDAQGGIQGNNLIQVARAVADEDYPVAAAPGAWTRLSVVESGVFNNRQKWDFIRLTPDKEIGDQGFLADYLFGEGSGPVRKTDSLRPAYFEFSPGEALMSKFQELAQERGTPLIWETLGVVPVEVQASVERLGGVNYNPGIWGDEKSWGEKGPNPYYYEHHLPNSYATLSLHDSTTERVRWEQEISPSVKQSLLNEWFGVGGWSQDDLTTMTPKVQEKLLEKYVYDSPARMAVTAWVDLLGLGDDYRLNTPGKQGGQWRARLPADVTLENLLAAAQGKPATPRAQAVVALMRRLTEKGRRTQADVTAVTTGEILRVNPEPDSKMAPVQEIGESFLVDAYVKGTPRQVHAVVTNTQGEQQVVAMTLLPTSVKPGLPDGMTKWSARVAPQQPGDYTFVVQSTDDAGVLRSSGMGRLSVVARGVNLNPLSGDYRRLAALGEDAAKQVILNKIESLPAAKAFSAQVLAEELGADLSLVAETLNRNGFAPVEGRSGWWVRPGGVGAESVTTPVERDNLISVGISLGGTKIGAHHVQNGRVDASTADLLWKTRYGVSATPENILDGIVEQVQKVEAQLNGKQVVSVKVGFAGPVDTNHGITGTPFKAPNLPFENYPFKAELERRLRETFGHPVIVRVRNDAHEAAEGESISPDGSLRDGNGMAFILGTGNNGGAIENGLPFIGAQGEIIELGHNMVRGIDGVWRFTGFETHGNKATLQPGEKTFEQLLGGPRIAERFAASANAEDLLAFITPSSGFVSAQAVLDILRRPVAELGEEEGKRWAQAVDSVLRALTTAAVEKNTAARRFVQDTGEMVGQGLASMVQHYPDNKWPEHIVLVSGVGENFAKGAVNDNGDDLFLSAIRQGMGDGLRQAGWGAEKIARVTAGLVRSQMTSQREVIASELTEQDIADWETVSVNNVGGIDLNPDQLNLQIRRDGNGVPLPMNRQPIGTMNIDGFMPVIINAAPVNGSFLLGAAEAGT